LFFRKITLETRAPVGSCGTKIKKTADFWMGRKAIFERILRKNCFGGRGVCKNSLGISQGGTLIIAQAAFRQIFVKNLTKI